MWNVRLCVRLYRIEWISEIDQLCHEKKSCAVGFYWFEAFGLAIDDAKSLDKPIIHIAKDGWLATASRVCEFSSWARGVAVCKDASYTLYKRLLSNIFISHNAD